MKRLIQYAKPYVAYILIAALAGAGCSAANVWIIDILKQVIDCSLTGEVLAALPLLAMKAAAAVMVGMAANYLVIAMTGLFGSGILRDLRRDTLTHIMKMSPDFMERNNYGDIIERLSSDVSGIASYMQTYFKDCLYVPIVVVVFAVYLISLHPLLAVVCLGPLVIMVPLSIRLLGPVKKAQAEYVKLLGLTNNDIKEAFDGAEIIKSYNLQGRMRDKYFGKLKETLDISNKNDLRQYNIDPLSGLIREAPTAIALCVGGALVFGGNVTLGVLVAFISGIEKINEPLVGAYQLVVRSQMAMVAIRRVFEILDMPIETNEGKSAKVNRSHGAVFTLREVGFSYERIEPKALQNISLEIPQGKRIALVGPSGCGKSTLLKILCGQYGASEGEVLFYGSKYSDMKLEAIREELALISQDTILFPMSIMDNIRMGRAEATEEEIIKAAQMAGCDEFIRALPQGYHTKLEEKGSNLSGGQRQRLSIARAILKDAPVLLLDEPTSALDRETEKYVNRTLSEIAHDKTVVTVAHRLSTIVDYDEILVFDRGQIIERGTHEELWTAQGTYYKMYEEYNVSGGVEA